MISFYKPKGLMVIIQVTDKCQLECPYCMASKSEKAISEDTILKIFRFLDENIDAKRHITFVWHGGEPLLMRAKFYKWVYGQQLLFKRGKSLVNNIIQTNGLLITNELIDLIRESNDFSLNISMDGPNVITQKTRGISSDRYDVIFSKLQQNRIAFGVAVVASEDVLLHKEEVIDYFESRDILNVALVPYHIFPHNELKQLPRAKYSVNGKDVIENHFTLTAPKPRPDILYLLMHNEDGTPNLFGKSFHKGIIHQFFHSDCMFSTFSDGCHKEVLNISVNGEIFPCPRGQNVNLWNYGSVNETGLENWLKSTLGPSPFRTQTPSECGSCKYVSKCHGGCPANSKSMSGGAERKDYYCESYFQTFQQIENEILTKLEKTLPVA